MNAARGATDVSERPGLLSTVHFAMFRDLIEEQCGLHFDDTQRRSLSASVWARMKQLGLLRVDEYYDRLAPGTVTPIEAELRHLVNLITVTETCFFRDPTQFALLSSHLLPTLIAGRAARGASEASRTLRIWSAGCSSGEEAYSIALTLWDMGLYAAYPDWTFDIVGTDLNTRVLDAARRGVYTARAVRNVEPACLRRHFTRDGAHFILTDEIKRRVRFEHGNLTQTPMRPPSDALQDIVFCKNVAIYFRAEAAQRLLRGIHHTLADGGYLLRGHSESLWQFADGFTVVEHEGAFCYRKAPERGPVVQAAGRARRGIADVPRTAPRSHGAATLSSDSASGEYASCLAALRAGDWTAAEAGLNALVRVCPTFVPALLLLGGLYVHRGRYDDAIQQAERVLLLSDLEPRAHLLLGMIAARRGRADEAIRLLRRTLYLDDTLALAHFWLGNLYRDRGDRARACLEYQNVVLDWERHTLDMTEEFAIDLSQTQVVSFCRDGLAQLRSGA